MAEYKQPRDSTLDKRVRRGIELLDERVPGWRDRVSTTNMSILSIGRTGNTKIDVGDCSRCMLASVFRTDYEEAVDLLKLTRKQCVDNGFALTVGGLLEDDSADYDAEYDRLDAAWLRGLKAIGL